MGAGGCTSTGSDKVARDLVVGDCRGSAYRVVDPSSDMSSSVERKNIYSEQKFMDGPVA